MSKDSHFVLPITSRSGGELVIYGCEVCFSGLTTFIDSSCSSFRDQVMCWPWSKAASSGLLQGRGTGCQDRFVQDAVTAGMCVCVGVSVSVSGDVSVRTHACMQRRCMPIASAACFCHLFCLHAVIPFLASYVGLKMAAAIERIATKSRNEFVRHQLHTEHGLEQNYITHGVLQCN